MSCYNRRAKFFRWSALAWAAIAASASYAKTVVLFENGRPVSGYEDKAKSVVAGDRIRFSDGKEFVAAADPIDRGMIDYIIRVDELHEGKPVALRVPKRPFGQAISVDESYAGFKTLAAYRVPTPEVYEDLYLAGERLGVEWLDLLYSYARFQNEYRNLPVEERLHRLDELVEFAATTWAFRDIGDQADHQIGYARGKGWVVIDTLSDMSYVSRIEHGSIFAADVTNLRRNQYMMQTDQFISPYGEKLSYPKERAYVRKIDRAIRDARIRNDLPHTFCAQVGMKAGDALRWIAARLRHP